LADTAAHSAGAVWLRKLFRQPAVGRKEPRERRAQRVDARRQVRDRARHTTRLIDQRANLWHVDDEAEVGMMVM
jgi:hypothetical protein